MLQHLAIDLGNTNTLIATRDQEGTEALLHLPGISQIQTQLSAGTEMPFTLVPSEVFHSNDGPEIGARAWAKLQQDDSPDAYRRYGRNFKRQLLDSFLEARHGEEGHRSLLESSTDFVHVLCNVLRQELELEFGSSRIPSLILTAPVQAPAEYRAWLRGVFNEQLNPESVRMIDESTAAALFYGQQNFSSRVLIVDVGGSTSDITLADIGFSGDGMPIEARLISKSGKVVGGSSIDDLIAESAFQLQGLQSPSSYNRKSYLRAIRAGEAVKKRLSFSRRANESYEDLQAGLTINMSFRNSDLEAMVEGSPVASSLRELVQDTVAHIQQRGISLSSINGAILVGGCTICPPVRAILTKTFSDFDLELSDSPTEADRFAAVVFGALRSADAPVSNDYLLHDYAIRIKAKNGNSVYQTLFPKGTVIPCVSGYTLHFSRRSQQQVGIRVSVGELYRQPRQLSGDSVDPSDSGPLVATDFRPLSTEGHLVVIPIDSSVPVGQRRYRISFGIDAERQLRITVDDTIASKRLFDNAVIGDLNQSAPIPADEEPPMVVAPEVANFSSAQQRILELNPNPSYNNLEVEVANVLRDMQLEGFLISNVILGHHLHEADHLLFTTSGQIYIMECKNYSGTWSGGINSQWICTAPDGSERVINAKPVNPMLQCRRYIGDVLRRIGSQYPECQFRKACLVIAPDHAHLDGISGCGDNLMNVSSLPGFVQRMEERSRDRPVVNLEVEKLKRAFYLI
jgi:molecular chaperone DnaK (HSP70)